MSLFVLPRQSPVQGGNSYPGAKAYFYATGTTTPETVYTDSARTVAHSNPVVADANGVFGAIWLDPSKTYRVRLTTSSDVLLYDVDPYPGGVLDADAVGVALYPRTAAEQSAGITPTNYGYPAGNVKRYGATGDGTTDDTTGVQSALTVGGTVTVPDGVFLASNLTGTDVRIQGTGTIKKLENTTGSLLTLTGSNTIEGVTIDGNWTNVTDAPSYSLKVSVYQTDGSLSLIGATFTNSLFAAVRVRNTSLFVSHCKFSGGAPHNDLDGGNERVTQYIYADANASILDTARINISNSEFIGAELSDSALYYLNPAGIFINSNDIDGERYKNVVIHGNTFEGCGQNAGPGNLTAPVDTYNGVENISITGNVIRKFSYSGLKIQNSGNVTITGNIIEDGVSGASASTPNLAIPIIVLEKQRSATQEKSRITIQSNVIDGASYAGILVNTDDTVIANNVLNDIALDSTTGHGIWSTGSHVKIIGNVVRNHGGYGIYSTGDDVLIDGNTTVNTNGTNNISIFFSGSRYQIRGNDVRNATTSPTNPGIRTNGPASTLLIEGNVCHNVGTGIDLRVTSGAVSAVTLRDNVFGTVTTPTLVNASVTGVSAVTRGATSVADGGTVTHGHPTTPTNVRVTPSTTGEFASVTAIGATTFTVALKKHDNTAGTTQTVYWEAAS